MIYTPGFLEHGMRSPRERGCGLRRYLRIPTRGPLQTHQPQRRLRPTDFVHKNARSWHYLPMAIDMAQSAAEFIKEFGDMAQRLAAKKIAITSLDCNWRSFGGWTLTACNGDLLQESHRRNDRNPFTVAGPEFIRVCRDGRDGYVQIESSPSEYLSSPNQWRSELDKAFPPGDEAVIPFVEVYLSKRLAS
jgi:hypothetical protein